MLNFEEELKKFQPCLEVEDIEDAVYQEDLADMTDLLREVIDKRSKRLWGLYGVYTESSLSVQLLYNDGT